MRRKPTSNNGTGGGYNNNQQRRPRYTGSGGEHRPQNNGGQHSGNRPRKNYGMMREKYLAQARDALASGDRVLAENYFQHADHCYRMLVEEGLNNPRPQHISPPRSDEQNQHGQANENGGENGHEQDSGHHDNHGEEQVPENTNALPAFLTVPFGPTGQPAEPPPAQNWEERDA